MCILATNKRNPLYFVAITQLTMDYSPINLKGDVVDSPFSHGAIPLAMNSPSRLQIFN